MSKYLCFLAYNWPAFIQIGGLFALTRYYYKKLLKVDATEIMKKISIGFIITWCFHYIQKYTFLKYKEIDYSKISIPSYPLMLLQLLLVIGEDSLFIINYLPKYKNNIYLKILTTTIFASLHIPFYGVVLSFVKGVSTFPALFLVDNLVNFHIAHYLIDVYGFIIIKN